MARYGQQYSAKSTVHLLRQQKKEVFLFGLGFSFPYFQTTGSATVHNPLSLMDHVTPKVDNADKQNLLSGPLHPSAPLSVHLQGNKEKQFLPNYWKRVDHKTSHLFFSGAQHHEV